MKNIKSGYLAERLWLEENLKFKPLSATGYLGPLLKFSINSRYIPNHERTVINYVSDNFKDIDLNDIFSIDGTNYTLDEFKNFKYTYNNFGFRDDIDYEIDNGKDEIWCFGCSFTVGIGVPKERNWPSLIQKETGATVKNFGVSGGGLPTISRLLKNWLEFSKYPPKHILLLGYFDNRFEVEGISGEIHRIGLSAHNYDTAKFHKNDIKRIKDAANEFIKNEDEWIKTETDKVNEILKNHSHLLVDVHEQKIDLSGLGRDIQFFKFINGEEQLIKNEKLTSLYYKHAHNFFNNINFNEFGKTWICHPGINYHRIVAEEFLQNLTI